MRNDNFLESTRPEDENIGELFYEDGCSFRIVNGKKIRQLEETDKNKDLQKCINRVRASGLKPSEYLKIFI